MRTILASSLLLTCSLTFLLPEGGCCSLPALFEGLAPSSGTSATQPLPPERDCCCPCEKPAAEKTGPCAPERPAPVPLTGSCCCAQRASLEPPLQVRWHPPLACVEVVPDLAQAPVPGHLVRGHTLPRSQVPLRLLHCVWLC